MITVFMMFLSKSMTKLSSVNIYQLGDLHNWASVKLEDTLAMQILRETINGILCCFGGNIIIIIIKLYYRLAVTHVRRQI